MHILDNCNVVHCNVVQTLWLNILTSAVVSNEKSRFMRGPKSASKEEFVDTEFGLAELEEISVVILYILHMASTRDALGPPFGLRCQQMTPGMQRRSLG
jgi:hypothetical protein